MQGPVTNNTAQPAINNNAQPTINQANPPSPDRVRLRIEVRWRLAPYLLDEAASCDQRIFFFFLLQTFADALMQGPVTNNTAQPAINNPSNPPGPAEVRRCPRLILLYSWNCHTSPRPVIAPFPAALFYFDLPLPGRPSRSHPRQASQTDGRPPR